jgi:hypothetical protein
MAAPQTIVQAVQMAIVASAHLTAYEQVSAAARAVERLGGLTSGRWRAAGRELGDLEDDLQAAFSTAAENLGSRAEAIGVPEETLWRVGDAASLLEALRDRALDELDQESRAARILQGQVLFGTSLIEDPDLPDRGATLLFGWPEPLSPASWPWQANWVVGDNQDDGEADNDDEANELDLFEAGELEGEEPILAELADELQCSRSDARVALREAALALTRASLLTDATEEEDEPEDEGEEDDDESNHNGEA